MDNKLNPEIQIRELKDAERDEVVGRCKELYFRYWALADIAKQMDVNYGTLKKWVTRYGWYKEREALEVEAQTDAIKRRAAETAEIMRDGLVAIKDTIAKYQKAGSMDMKDAVALSGLLTNIDKLMRLAEGKATDITEERSLKASLTASTVVDVLNPRDVDPFATPLTEKGEDAPEE